jgi:hypothetical protein
MSRKKAIGLLNMCLEEVPQLKGLDYVASDFNEREGNRQRLILWIDKCKEVIKTGPNPEDAKKFVSYRPGHVKGFEQQEDYAGRIIDYETQLIETRRKWEQLSNFKWYLKKATPILANTWREFKDFLVIMANIFKRKGQT